MPNSKRTKVPCNMAKKKKKNRRYLMTSKKCWIIEDKLMPLYSHLIDRYTNQLLGDPFCCEDIKVKQEPQDDYPLESLLSADKQKSNSHLDNEVIIIYLL